MLRTTNGEIKTSPVEHIEISKHQAYGDAKNLQRETRISMQLTSRQQ